MRQGAGSAGWSRRRVLAGPGVTLGAAGLASCGVGGRDVAHEGGPALGEAVAIELLAGLTAQQQSTFGEHVAGAFERAHPGIRLGTIEAPAAQVDQKLLALVSGGTPPDVMFNAPPSLYLGGLTRDLTERVRRDRVATGGLVKEGFDSAAVWRGKVVNLPYYVGGHSSVLPYNRELFARAGIPEPPGRWGARGWDGDGWLRSLRATTRADGIGRERTFGVNVTS
ncbi:MAG TPA: extracellular solute-binding protein, partial [Chloroflexota bacterium]|nr:extracellular solute-binding protein [Chloroflexota bacterium]